MTLLCSVVQLCTVSTLPCHQTTGSALDSPKASNKEQLEISQISSDEITETYQGSTKISEMESCWYKGIAVEAFEKHSLSKRKDDNTFKSQYGQGNPRGAPRQHQNKTGMEIVGLKAQLQSNLFEDLEYQKVK
ncbi:hypothetical protein RRG08_028093 [Elysia crispata]|uniref:Uncharacterized protein n=1 Tax=Elysia crispata TaxID=231223 RepID=A0AAE1E6G6_9GAST|nr:hypothetical protein RRG08_028093 [Elysia crispata]